MLHQPSIHRQGHSVSSVTEMEIDAREMVQLKGKLEELVSNFTGKKPEIISRDMDRDFYMTSEEAKAYGLIDAVITSASDVKKKSK